MAQYIYPAVFTPEENGLYSVNFPDLQSCYTSGNNLKDAIKMAEDILAYVLYDYEKDGLEIPTPSEMKEIALSKDEFVNYIVCDTIGYQKRFNNKSVKKTITVPMWLNELALKNDLNFSQTLQEALLKKLNIK